MKFLITAILALFITSPSILAETGDDGLHKQPWIQDTFKDLPEDLTDANAEDKRLVIFVEQRGCVYCTKMHEEVFSDPAISEMIQAKYYVVQINLHGDTEVTDFDGQVLSEKDAVRKWGVLFTPTIIFLPENVAPDTTAIQAAVSVMPGAFGKGTTMDMFTWVHEERYLLDDGEDFQRYHARRIRERSNGSTD